MNRNTALMEMLKLRQELQRYNIPKGTRNLINEHVDKLREAQDYEGAVKYLKCVLNEIKLDIPF